MQKLQLNLGDVFIMASIIQSGNVVGNLKNIEVVVPNKFLSIYKMSISKNILIVLLNYRESKKG